MPILQTGNNTSRFPTGGYAYSQADMERRNPFSGILSRKVDYMLERMIEVLQDENPNLTEHEMYTAIESALVARFGKPMGSRIIAVPRANNRYNDFQRDQYRQ